MSPRGTSFDDLPKFSIFLLPWSDWFKSLGMVLPNFDKSSVLAAVFGLGIPRGVISLYCAILGLTISWFSPSWFLVNYPIPIFPVLEFCVARIYFWHNPEVVKQQKSSKIAPNYFIMPQLTLTQFFCKFLKLLKNATTSESGIFYLLLFWGLN